MFFKSQNGWFLASWASSPFLKANIGCVEAVNLEGALPGLQDPEEGQAYAGLAGPCPPHQAHLLPGPDRQVEVGEDRGQLLTVGSGILTELYPPLGRPVLRQK